VKRAWRWLRAEGVSSRQGMVDGRMAQLGLAYLERGRWWWSVAPIGGDSDSREAAEAEVDRLLGERGWELAADAAGEVVS
jgi:hypothetical protein